MRVTRVWDNARTEQLRKLHADGFSAALISRMMGVFTKGSVASKLRRIGLRGEPTKHGKAGRPKASEPRPVELVPPPPSIAEEFGIEVVTRTVPNMLTLGSNGDATIQVSVSRVRFLERKV